MALIPGYICWYSLPEGQVIQTTNTCSLQFLDSSVKTSHKLRKISLHLGSEDWDPFAFCTILWYNPLHPLSHLTNENAIKWPLNVSFFPILFKFNLVSRVQIVGWEGNSKRGRNASPCEISGEDSVTQTGARAGTGDNTSVVATISRDLRGCVLLSGDLPAIHTMTKGFLVWNLSRCWMPYSSTTCRRGCHSCARGHGEGLVPAAPRAARPRLSVQSVERERDRVPYGGYTD